MPQTAGILGGILGRTDDALPAWFADQQRAAWTQFQSLPMPARTDQAWRFSNLAALDLSPYSAVGPVSEADGREILERSTGLDQISGRLVFADDHILERDVLSEKLSKTGVIFQPLERAVATASRGAVPGCSARARAVDRLPPSGWRRIPAWISMRLALAVPSSSKPRCMVSRIRRISATRGVAEGEEAREGRPQ